MVLSMHKSNNRFYGKSSASGGALPQTSHCGFASGPTGDYRPLDPLPLLPREKIF